MFIPNGYEKPVQESVEYTDEGELICNMEGSTWESLPYPVIIDSGAAASVLPERWCDHVETYPMAEPRNGLHYTAANGGKIFNRGEKLSLIHI